MQTIVSQLSELFRTAIREAFGIDADPIITPSQNESFGDYQSNAAMSLAKQVTAKTGQKTNPRAVAEQIKGKLSLGEMAQDVTIAGPGFVNVKLEPGWVARRLAKNQVDNELGLEKTPSPQRVVVDYSAPNVAKELHVGHLRSTIIGDAISRILEARGHEVIRQNHVGDWGTQFGMLIAHLRSLGNTDASKIEDLNKLYVEANKRFKEEPAFADEARQTVVRLQGGGAEERESWQRMVDASRRYYQTLYTQLGVGLATEHERGESFYNSFLPNVVRDLTDAKLAVESDGAKVVFTTGYEAPLIIEKSGGGYLYGTTDLAALRYRVNGMRAQRIIYVVGLPQSQHLAQVFDVARRAGWANDVQLEHAGFGSVLGEDGKLLRGRGGGAIKLKDLLDEAEERGQQLARQKYEERLAKSKEQGNKDFETLTDDQLRHIGTKVGVGAVKYADLSKDRTSDYVFSWDKMLAMDGNTAPYLQYAYARIRSIFRKSGAEPKPGAELKLESPFELSLAKHILKFGEVIELVARELRPHYLATYLYDLATKFSVFYENCPVLQSDEAMRSSRLALCDLTARTLSKGLDLLGIEHSEQM